MDTEEACDEVFKVLLIGREGSGKTNLLLRFVDGTFSGEVNDGLELDKSKVVVVGDKKIRVVTVDTGGKEKFRQVTSSSYIGVNGIFFVFSIADLKTFSQLTKWIEDANQYKNSFCSIVIGNKTDLDKRVVSAEQGKQFADEHNLEYFETSAKTGDNVEEAFMRLVEQMIEAKKKKKSSKESKDESSGCCTIL